MLRCVFRAAIVGLLVSSAGAQSGSILVTPRRSDFVADAHRPLATLPPAKMSWYHTNTPPQVGNGRLFQGKVFRNSPRPEIDWPGPGPERYGAPNDDGSVVHARIGRAVLSFSPWMTYRYVQPRRVDLRYWNARSWSRRPTGLSQGFTSPAAQRAERDIRHARNVWLRERGYVGGVRTFKNPVRSGDASAGRTPEPAGWFRKPAEFPRTKSSEHVRLSLPPGISPRAAARLREMETDAIASNGAR